MSFVRSTFNFLSGIGSADKGEPFIRPKNEDFDDVTLETECYELEPQIKDVKRLEAVTSVGFLQSSKFESVLDRIKFSYPSSTNLPFMSAVDDPDKLLTQLLLIEKVHLQVQDGLLNGLTREEVGGPIYWLLDFFGEVFPEVAEKKLAGTLRNLFIPPLQTSINHLQEMSAQIRQKIKVTNPETSQNPYLAFNLLKNEQGIFSDFPEDSIESIEVELSSLIEENKAMISEIRCFYSTNFLTIPEDLSQKLTADVLDISMSDTTCDTDSDSFRNAYADLKDLTIEEKVDLWIIDKNLENFCKKYNILNHGINAECCVHRMRLGLIANEIFELNAISFLNIALLEELKKFASIDEGVVTVFSRNFESLVKSKFFSSKISSLAVFAPPLQDCPLDQVSLAESRKNLFILEKIFLPVVDVENRVLASFHRYLLTEKTEIPIFKGFAKICSKKRMEIQEKLDLIDSLIRKHRNLTSVSSSILPAISLGMEINPLPNDKDFWVKTNRYNSLFFSETEGRR